LKRTLLNITLMVLLCQGILFLQNGKIVKRKSYDIFKFPEVVKKIAKKEDGKLILFPEFEYLNHVAIEKISYLSDGLKVTGFLAYPKGAGKYPCVIYNRGGNREFGAINPLKVAFVLARVAAWGYVVVSSQYRGNDGGEGKEAFGGKDVNDVLNLIPLLENLSNTDTPRIGMYGWSRGGMMTYLSIIRTDRIKAAVVGGGVSDLFMMKDHRPEMETYVYRELMPDYDKNKKALLDARSAVKHADKICKTTPILIMHGTADWRVVPQQAIALASELLKEKVPFRLVLFEGGDHGLSEHRVEVNELIKMWLDRYVKNRGKLPDLTPHGK